MFLAVIPASAGLLQRLDRLGVEQDLLWFWVLLGWSFCLIFWRGSPGRETHWRWAPWAAAAGVATALLQFLTFNPPFDFFYSRLTPGTAGRYTASLIDPDLFADIMLAGVYVAVAVLGWGRLATGTKAPVWRWLLAVLGVGLVWWHVRVPQATAWVLALLPFAGFTCLWRGTAQSPWARWALAATACLPLVSPIGPLAVLGERLQRLGPTSGLGAVAALFNLVAVAAMLMGLAREQFQAMTATARQAYWREVRPFVMGGVLWVIAGTGFALLSGHDNAYEVKTNRLRQTAARAEEIHVALAARLRTGSEPALLAAELRRLRAVTPYTKDVAFIVRRDGRLVRLTATVDGLATGALRVSAPDDLQAWAHGEQKIVSLPVPEGGTPYFTRAPVRNEAGEMTAWLEFAWEEFYSTLDRKWRTGPLLMTALGAVLAALFFVQRRSGREREEALRAAAVSAEATRIKTAFLAKVSHELRTPLQSILGYAELLQGEVKGDAGRKQLGALQHHGQLMTRLVNDLIDLGALESGAFRLVEKPVQPAELVRQTVESLRARAAAKGLGLGLAVTPQVPDWIIADGERLRQLVLNLVGNAVKFTATGRVDVALATEAGPAQPWLMLTVRDTGPGIAAEEHRRIFEPYYRVGLTAQEQGSGLGLALVAGLCGSMGGEVRVESAPGAGASFQVRLPLRPAAAPASPVAAVRPGAWLEGQRILIADDNDLVRELFMGYLQSLGAECTAAKDGAEALQQAQVNRFAAIVLDLAMPGLTGAEVARRLRAVGTTARIIGVSAHTDAADRADALAAGMDAFLTKPVELAELGRTLAAAVAPSSSREDGLARVREGIARRFRAGAADEVARIAAALDRKDRAALKVRAHDLMNSAFAVGDHPLGRAAAQFERALEDSDEAGVAAAWSACLVALQPWLGAE